MRDRFQYDVTHAVGLSLQKLQENNFIGTRKPTEVRRLSNGNTLYTYGDYWAQYGIRRERCDLFIEVNVNTNSVVAARAEGGGCYTPY